nr:MAG TPA: hypothetical protein [Caudoviricetes sp.]
MGRAFPTSQEPVRVCRARYFSTFTFPYFTSK